MHTGCAIDAVLKTTLKVEGGITIKRALGFQFERRRGQRHVF